MLRTNILPLGCGGQPVLCLAGRALDASTATKTELACPDLLLEGGVVVC